VSEIKFTPGPWVPGHIANDDHPCDCASIVSEYFAGSIAYVTVDNGKLIQDGGNDGPPLEQAKANSHLIAAAPELFEALEGFMTFHSGHCIANDDLAARLQDGHAALAKARGEAQ